MWKPLLALAALAACNQAPADVITQPDDSRLTFAGYDCTDDCSGHEAGYEWAEARGATHEDDCDGKSDSFIEGCLAFVADISADSGESDYEG